MKVKEVSRSKPASAQPGTEQQPCTERMTKTSPDPESKPGPNSNKYAAIATGAGVVAGHATGPPAPPRALRSRTRKATKGTKSKSKPLIPTNLPSPKRATETGRVEKEKDGAALCGVYPRVSGSGRKKGGKRTRVEYTVEDQLRFENRWLREENRELLEKNTELRMRVGLLESKLADADARLQTKADTSSESSESSESEVICVRRC